MIFFTRGIEVIWVDADLFGKAVARYVQASPADLSLVDCVSFALMNNRSLTVCLSFDDHFRREGFRLLRA